MEVLHQAIVITHAHVAVPIVLMKGTPQIMVAQVAAITHQEVHKALVIHQALGAGQHVLMVNQIAPLTATNALIAIIAVGTITTADVVAAGVTIIVARVALTARQAVLTVHQVVAVVHQAVAAVHQAVVHHVDLAKAIW